MGGFYSGNGADPAANLANPDPAQLSDDGFGSFEFTLDLVLGGRADHNAGRHFLGKLALVTIFDFTLSHDQVGCLFRAGDATLPDPHASDSSCEELACQNGATCQRAFGHYMCNCAEGFDGPTCGHEAVGSG